LPSRGSMLFPASFAVLVDTIDTTNTPENAHSSQEHSRYAKLHREFSDCQVENSAIIHSGNRRQSTLQCRGRCSSTNCNINLQLNVKVRDISLKINFNSTEIYFSLSTVLAETVE
jgi:hypothetical protein